VTRPGGRILVDQLAAHGAELAFGVPGESYLAVLDALYDGPVRFIPARHEANAANMAEAYGKLTGRPGVCLVTRGPGAMHAAIGVHTARQDSTPLLLLVGQVPRGTSGREAFQELDLRAVFGSVAKWAGQVEDVARLPEILARAFWVARSGRPGPVVVGLPEDVLSAEAEVLDAAGAPVAAAAPPSADLERLRAVIAEARRPLVVVGEGGWSARAAEDLVAFATAAAIPVAASFRCQDYVDNEAEVYAGHAGIGTMPALRERIEQADVLVAVGGRLGDIPSGGYGLLEIPRPRQRLVHVHPDPDELGAVYQPELAIVSGLPEFAAAARSLDLGEGASARRPLVAEAHTAYEENRDRHRELPGDLELSEVMALLRDRLGPDAILTSGAGNFTVWAHRFYSFRRFGTQLAPRSGAMGYGVPAAVAAKAIHPERTVVCLAGDGDFLMSGQELATAVQEGLNVVVLVVNNGMWGTIRMHQERHYPGRVVATDLRNPDFAALARAFGAHGAVVERTEDAGAALDEALAAGRPAVLELRVDPEAITPVQTLSEIREAAV
jgi:acetolactate synthase I/II/III large subunit